MSRETKIPGFSIKRYPNKWVAVTYHYTSHPTKRDPEWAKSMAQSYPGGMDGAAWRAEMEIDFGARSGKRVYVPPFSRTTHLIKPFRIPQEWPRFRSIDPGFRNPTACLWGALSPEGILYLYREYYVSERTIPEHSAAIRAMSAGELYEWTLMDPSAFSQTLGSPESIAEQFSQQGLIAGRGDNRLEDGIQNVAKWLVIRDDGHPSIVIFENLEKLIWEMEEYKYPKLSEHQKEVSNEKEKPLKKDDHLMDALRYMIQSCPDLSAGARRIGHTRRTFAQRVWACTQRKLKGMDDADDLSGPIAQAL